MIGRKTGGRQKGTQNKLTHDVRAAILDAAESMGGAARLAEWAKESPENERLFWSRIYTRVLPKELTVSADVTDELAERLARARERLESGG